MSPADVFTPMQLQAIEQLVEQKLQARGAVAASSPVPPELISPEEASRRLGGRPSGDTIRGLIHRGRIPRRLAGDEPKPGGRASFLVTTDEVLAALVATGKPAPTPEPVDLEAARARARERAAKRGGR